MEKVLEFNTGRCKVALLKEGIIGIYSIKENEYERVESLSYIVYGNSDDIKEARDTVFKLPADIPFSARNMSHIFAQWNKLWIKLDPTVENITVIKERPVKVATTTGEQASDI